MSRSVQERASRFNDRVVVVGTGRLGRTILRSLPRAISGVVTTQVEGSLAVKGFSSPIRYSRIQDVPLEAFDIVWIAVPDDKIQGLAEQAAQDREDWSGKLVVHSSGATSITALNPVASLGAEPAVAHPNLILAGDAPFPQNSVWGITSSSETYTRIKHLFREFEPVLIRIDDKKRSLYHAGATMAANYPMTLFSLGVELYKRAGVPDDLAIRVVQEFMAKSVETVAERGIREGLTGPVQRGDQKTLNEHLEAFKTEFPEEHKFFVELIEATRRAMKEGRGRAGEERTRGQGDKETRGQGDKETRR